MDKKYIILLVLVCGILGGGFFAIRSTMDRVAPEISFSEEQAEYHLSDTKEVLLQGVTASDDVDGDVTDTLVVENVFTDDAKGQATVVYVAKDSSNNVTKTSRFMIWNPENNETETESETETEVVTEAPQTEPETEEESESEAASEAEAETAEAQTAAAQTEETETEAAVIAEEKQSEEPETQEQTESEAIVIPEEEEDLDAYYAEIFAELSPERPRLRLTNRKLAVSVGDSFDPLIYVQSIEDDYDNKYELWRQISVEGEVNTKVPGIYQLIYTATDSSGNVSNRAMLLVDVQGEYEDETEE